DAGVVGLEYVIESGEDRIHQSTRYLTEGYRRVAKIEEPLQPVPQLIVQRDLGDCCLDQHLQWYDVELTNSGKDRSILSGSPHDQKRIVPLIGNDMRARLSVERYPLLCAQSCGCGNERFHR